jgi:hypothetical protein
VLLVVLIAINSFETVIFVYKMPDNFNVIFNKIIPPILIHL